MLEAVGGFTVFGFTGATSVAKRHAAIRTFQEQGQQRTGGAKVFVCTIKVRLRRDQPPQPAAEGPCPTLLKLCLPHGQTGAVGITLTAATRVYLLEPCFDPAAEAQAAGRIHRLGQVNDVLIKRFCARHRDCLPFPSARPTALLPSSPSVAGFRNSIEAQIVALHDAIKSGAVKVSNGIIDMKGVQIIDKKG